MQLAIVKGLKRNLGHVIVSFSFFFLQRSSTHKLDLTTYAAATANPHARFALRGDVNSLDCPASPEFAIVQSASALSKSTSI